MAGASGLQFTDQNYAIQEEGRKVVAVTGTAVAVTTSEACAVLVLQALATNTGNIAFGKAPSIVAGAEKGVQLEPGQTAEFKTPTANTIKINGAATDGVIYWILG